jgi:hypothetical protein
MTTPQKTKLLIWIAAFAVILACVPSFAAPAVPTVNPGAVNTFIAQTVRAAATQTAGAMPSATLTPSLTPTRNTETPSPTVTATVLFILSTPTPIIVPTFTSVHPILGGSGTSADNYACQITKVSPPNGSVFSPRADFDVVWTVKNIGKKNWDRTDVNYIYLSGSKIHKISGYDLPENVKVGNSVNLGVDMRAPKATGTYQTTWTMQVGSKEFCPMNFTLVVR